MRWLKPGEIAPSLRALFRTDDPQAPRCFSVLDGNGPGKILTDHLANPTWGAVWEAYDGATFLGGAPDATTVAQVVTALRQENQVVIGLWLGDSQADLLPPNPDYEGLALEFFDRPAGEGLEPTLRRLPAGCELRRMDRNLILRTEWGPDDVKHAGGLDAWEATCFGYCLMRGDEILCEASVGPAALGLREPGVFTPEAQRGNGYATITSARLIQEIERLGHQTYWDCAKQNGASTTVARKLGYRIEKEYRVLAWDKLPRPTGTTKL